MTYRILITMPYFDVQSQRAEHWSPHTFDEFSHAQHFVADIPEAYEAVILQEVRRKPQDDALNRIAEMQDELNCTLVPWETDGSTPANWVRKTGLGKVVAKIDRWCGGFQSSSNPKMIGWRVQLGGCSFKEGVVTLPDEYIDASHAVTALTSRCDEILRKQTSYTILETQENP